MRGKIIKKNGCSLLVRNCKCMINLITYSLFLLETCLKWNKSHFQKDFLFEMHNLLLLSIGGFRDSRYDVISAHAQITGRQYSGQHNGHMYGMHVNVVEIMPYFRKYIAENVCSKIQTFFLVKGTFLCTSFTENCDACNRVTNTCRHTV